MPKLSSNLALAASSVFDFDPNLSLDQLDPNHYDYQPSLEQEISKALFFLSQGRLLPSYAGDFRIERIDHNLSPLEAESRVTNLILKQGYYLRRIIQNDHQLSDQPKYYLTRGLLGGARTLDQTRALLEESLITKRRVVFISYRWSQENDPQVDLLCAALQQQGILALRDRDSFELGDRIDEYMSLINHPAVDKTIMLVDEGYFNSRNCMNEMKLVFRNAELCKGRVIIIPLTPNLFTAYQHKKAEITKHWQQKHDQYQQEGNLSEAQLSMQIVKRIPLFLDTMAMQTSEILSKRAESNFQSLIVELGKIVKQTNLNLNQFLPFNPDKIYIDREAEQDFVINALIPSKIIVIIGIAGIGKSTLVRNTLHSIKEDLFRLFPDGVILVEFNSGISVIQAITNIVDSLESGNDHKDIYDSYQRLVRNKKILLLLDGAEDARMQKPSQDSQVYSLDDMLSPIDQSKSAVIMVTRTHDEVKDPERTLVLNELDEIQQRKLLLKHLSHYRPLADKYQSLLSGQDLYPEDNRDIRIILDYLAGIPLAIELAASYLARTNVSLKKFIDLLKESPFAVLNKDKSKVRSSDRHKGIEYLINNNIEQLEQISLDEESKKASRDVILILGNLAYLPFEYDRLKNIITYLYPNLTDHQLWAC